MRIPFTLLLAFALCACSTTNQNRASTAVVTPLNDLNLVNAPIPEVLAAAQRGPYTLVPEQNCQVLEQEIKALDEALGPDIDASLNQPNLGLLERGADAGSGAASGALQRTADGVIPFRG